MTSEPQIHQPIIAELFTTIHSQLTPCVTTIYPWLDPIYSPPSQITARNGDLIRPPVAFSQANSDIHAGVFHHPAQKPGEKAGPTFAKVGPAFLCAPEPEQISAATNQLSATIGLALPCD